MELEEDQDVHICLNCNSTITGLLNYITHKKTQCPSRKQTSQLKSSQDFHAVVSQNQSFTSQAESFTGQSQGFTGQSESFTSQSQGFTGQSESFTGQTQSFTGQPQSFTGQSQSFTGQSQSFTVLPPSSTVSQTQLPVSTLSESAPPQTLTIDVTDASSVFSQVFSPSSKVVNPNIVLSSTQSTEHDVFHSNQPTDSNVFSSSQTTESYHEERPVDFFSSLNLLSKSDAPKTQDTSHDNASLPISNLLEDLGFSSESEQDYDESDGSEYEPDDSGSDSDGQDPPRGYTGGKWKPGSRPPKGHTGGKWKPGHRPPRSHTGGKWKPGQQPSSSHTGGKWKPGSPQPQIPEGGKWKPVGGLSQEDHGKSHDSLSCPIKDSNNEEQISAQGFDALVDAVTSLDGATSQDDTNNMELLQQELESLANGELHPAGQSSQTDLMSEIVNEAVHGEHTYEESSSQNDNGDSNSENLNREEFTSSGTKSCQIVKKFNPLNLICEPCGKTFRNKKQYARHLRTAFHEKRIEGRSTGHKVMLECAPCGKTFTSKFNMTRHLLTIVHQKTAKGHPDELKLIIKYQPMMVRLSPFQCHICPFYCNFQDDLKQHLQTESHLEKTSSLIGPLMCTSCKFRCNDSNELMTHLESKSHHESLVYNYKLCIIKESRHNINCKICGKQMHSAKQLECHVNTQHNENLDPLAKEPKSRHPECPHCDQRCVSNYALKIHIRRKHTMERPFRCNLCDIGFSDKYSSFLHELSIKHLNRVAGASEPVVGSFEGNQTGQWHRCRYCDFKVAEYKQLRGHFIKEHAKKKMTCEPCGMDFYNVLKYEQHLETESHGKMEEAAKNASEIYTCPICLRVFFHKKRFQIHYTNHPEFGMSKTYKDPEKSAMYAKYKDFVESIGELPFNQRVLCPECGKELTARYMESHLRSHFDETPYECDFCEKAFCERTILKRHVLMIHLQVQKNECKVCGKVFMKRSTYQAHILTHDKSAIKPYVCETCGASFWKAWQLTHHKRIHNKKFNCPNEGCTLSFASQSELNIHLRVHNNERPFLCDLCGYRGKTQNQLTRHRKVHTGERSFCCQYCPYKASNSTLLRRHMRIHTGSKPYKCPYCTYTCNTHENIRKHIKKTKKHAGLKIYPCRHCDYGTDLANEFRKHMETNHKEHIPQSLDFKDSATVAISGLYDGSYDPKAPLEGTEIIPVKERRSRKKARRDPVISSNNGLIPVQIQAINDANDGSGQVLVQSVNGEPILMENTNSEITVYVKPPENGQEQDTFMYVLPNAADR